MFDVCHLSGQGVEIVLAGRARIIIRECEYPTKGVDIHIYVEQVEEDIKKIHDNPQVCLPLS